MTRPVSIAGTIVTLVALYCSTGAAASPLLCLVVREPALGLEKRSVLEALAIERLKANLDFQTMEAETAKGCPGSSLGTTLIVTSTEARLISTQGLVLWFDVGDVEAVDRAREAARRIVTVYAALLRGERIPVVESHARAGPERARIARRGSARVRTAIPPDPKAFVSVRSGYARLGRAGLNAGMIAAGGGVVLFGERLVVEVSLGRLSWNEASQAGKVSVEALTASAVVRGGWVLGRLLLRVGTGFGLEHRALGLPSSLGNRSYTVPAFRGSVEAAWKVDDHFRAGLSAGFTGYPVGKDFTLEGRVLATAPTWSFSTDVCLGFVL